MRALYLLAGLLSLPLLPLLVGARILRHGGIPPALAKAFYRDPPGWKIVPVGDPESAARFEVVRSR